MKTVIYYYTGTGNSLWTARLFRKQMKNAKVFSMIDPKFEAELKKADAVGLVFPVHMWGVPNLALQFIKNLENYTDKYYFAVAVNAGQVSRTLIQLKNTMRSLRLTLSAGFDIVLPSNYIPWGGPGPEAERKKQFREAEDKIKKAVELLLKKQTMQVEKGPLWQRIIFTALYILTYNMIPKMDKDFWIDDKCNSCGICEKICPVKNIILSARKPVWQHHCEQCLACIQWCPQESIQLGKKTPQYERYHHPDIKIKDMFRL